MPWDAVHLVRDPFKQLVLRVTSQYGAQTPVKIVTDPAQRQPEVRVDQPPRELGLPGPSAAAQSDIHVNPGYTDRSGQRVMDVSLPTAGPSASRRGSGAVEIVVPPGTTIDVRLDGSPLELGGKFGPGSWVQNRTGDVRAVDIAGSMRMVSGSGVVAVSRVQGEFNAMTQAGRMRIGSFHGHGSLATEKGVVSVASARPSGDLHLRSTRGGEISCTAPDPAVQDRIKVQGTGRNINVHAARPAGVAQTAAGPRLARDRDNREPAHTTRSGRDR